MQTLQGRHGIYQKGDVAAMFRGKSARIAASVIPAG
jgi:hypothetical protein